MLPLSGPASRHLVRGRQAHGRVRTCVRSSPAPHCDRTAVGSTDRALSRGHHRQHLPAPPSPFLLGSQWEGPATCASSSVTGWGSLRFEQTPDLVSRDTGTGPGPDLRTARFLKEIQSQQGSEREPGSGPAEAARPGREAGQQRRAAGGGRGGRPPSEHSSLSTSRPGPPKPPLPTLQIRAPHPGQVPVQVPTGSRARGRGRGGAAGSWACPSPGSAAGPGGPAARLYAISKQFLLPGSTRPPRYRANLRKHPVRRREAPGTASIGEATTSSLSLWRVRWGRVWGTASRAPPELRPDPPSEAQEEARAGSGTGLSGRGSRLLRGVGEGGQAPRP